MKLARYLGQGRIGIVDEPEPSLPAGGLVVQTEACGLCSGELMAWYLDRKIPHVLGHEVAGRVVKSDDDRFPVGARVFVHHHAPCGTCALCQRGAYVHCPVWKATKLQPGGMAERFAAAAENLADTLRIDHLRPEDGALIEPLACVAKSLRKLNYQAGESAAVIGLGVMGLMHALLMPGCVAYDLNPARVEWARAQGVDAHPLDPQTPPDAMSREVVVVCPGNKAALDLSLHLVAPEGRVCLFAPLPPGEVPFDFERAYFRDITVVNAYSCGPNDTRVALAWLEAGRVRAEQVVSHFIELEALPEHYLRMRDGEIVKAMVQFRA